MSNTGVDKRKRLYEIVEVGEGSDRASRAYDLISALLIVVFLIVSIMETFDGMNARYGALFSVIDLVIVIYFTIDYILRLIVAKYVYPGKSEGAAVAAYIFSFAGLIDLLSFLPYYLPFFFPGGFAAFRMFRVVRIFRLFRINKYYDSLNVITEVLKKKKNQLLSSVFIVLILMIASSLCMYSVEHPVQPEAFKNAFSGIWWAASTLLTVGYGDIYPITALGKTLGIIITFLGVFIVAIPTGIISAGFVEQYQELNKRSEYLDESDVLFVKTRLAQGDPWVGREVQELDLPHGLLTAAVLREERSIVPHGDVLLQEGDIVVLGAEPTSDGEELDLKEFELSPGSSWAGKEVRDLDISRKTLIVMVRRGDEVIVPHGHTVLNAGDRVYVYTENRVHSAQI